jgi:flagellar motor switch protein FliN
MDCKIKRDPEDSIERNLAMLADIKVQVTIEVGSRRMPLKEVLALTPGKIIELQMGKDDPLTLKVGDKILAYCELVSDGNKTSIRVTEICGQDIFTNLMKVV